MVSRRNLRSRKNQSTEPSPRSKKNAPKRIFSRDIELQMECVEEELSPAQLEAINEAQKAHEKANELIKEVRAGNILVPSSQPNTFTIVPPKPQQQASKPAPSIAPTQTQKSLSPPQDQRGLPPPRPAQFLNKQIQEMTKGTTPDVILVSDPQASQLSIKTPVSLVSPSQVRQITPVLTQPGSNATPQQVYKFVSVPSNMPTSVVQNQWALRPLLTVPPQQQPHISLLPAGAQGVVPGITQIRTVTWQTQGQTPAVRPAVVTGEGLQKVGGAKLLGEGPQKVGTAKPVGEELNCVYKKGKWQPTVINRDYLKPLKSQRKTSCGFKDVFSDENRKISLKFQRTHITSSPIHLHKASSCPIRTSVLCKTGRDNHACCRLKVVTKVPMSLNEYSQRSVGNLTKTHRPASHMLSTSAKHSKSYVKRLVRNVLKTTLDKDRKRKSFKNSEVNKCANGNDNVKTKGDCDEQVNAIDVCDKTESALNIHNNTDDRNRSETGAGQNVGNNGERVISKSSLRQHVKVSKRRGDKRNIHNPYHRYEYRSRSCHRLQVDSDVSWETEWTNSCLCVPKAASSTQKSIRTADKFTKRNMLKTRNQKEIDGQYYRECKYKVKQPVRYLVTRPKVKKLRKEFPSKSRTQHNKQSTFEGKGLWSMSEKRKTLFGENSKWFSSGLNDFPCRQRIVSTVYMVHRTTGDPIDNFKSSQNVGDTDNSTVQGKLLSDVTNIHTINVEENDLNKISSMQNQPSWKIDSENNVVGTEFAEITNASKLSEDVPSDSDFTMIKKQSDCLEDNKDTTVISESGKKEHFGPNEIIEVRTDEGNIENCSENEISEIRSVEDNLETSNKDDMLESRSEKSAKADIELTSKPFVSEDLDLNDSCDKSKENLSNFADVGGIESDSVTDSSKVKETEFELTDSEERNTESTDKRSDNSTAVCDKDDGEKHSGPELSVPIETDLTGIVPKGSDEKCDGKESRNLPVFELLENRAGSNKCYNKMLTVHIADLCQKYGFTRMSRELQIPKTILLKLRRLVRNANHSNLNVRNFDGSDVILSPCGAYSNVESKEQVGASETSEHNTQRVCKRLDFNIDTLTLLDNTEIDELDRDCSVTDGDSSNCNNTVKMDHCYVEKSFPLSDIIGKDVEELERRINEVQEGKGGEEVEENKSKDSTWEIKWEQVEDRKLPVFTPYSAERLYSIVESALAIGINRTATIYGLPENHVFSLLRHTCNREGVNSCSEQTLSLGISPDYLNAWKKKEDLVELCCHGDSHDCYKDLLSLSSEDSKSNKHENRKEPVKTGCPSRLWTDPFIEYCILNDVPAKFKNYQEHNRNRQYVLKALEYLDTSACERFRKKGTGEISKFYKAEFVQKIVVLSSKIGVAAISRVLDVNKKQVSNYRKQCRAAVSKYCLQRAIDNSVSDSGLFIPKKSEKRNSNCMSVLENLLQMNNSVPHTNLIASIPEKLAENFDEDSNVGETVTVSSLEGNQFAKKKTSVCMNVRNPLGNISIFSKAQESRHLTFPNNLEIELCIEDEIKEACVDRKKKSGFLLKKSRDLDALADSKRSQRMSTNLKGQDSINDTEINVEDGDTWPTNSVGQASVSEIEALDSVIESDLSEVEKDCNGVKSTIDEIILTDSDGEHDEVVELISWDVDSDADANQPEPEIVHVVVHEAPANELEQLTAVFDRNSDSLANEIEQSRAVFDRNSEAEPNKIEQCSALVDSNQDNRNMPTGNNNGYSEYKNDETRNGQCKVLVSNEKEITRETELKQSINEDKLFGEGPQEAANESRSALSEAGSDETSALSPFQSDGNTVKAHVLGMENMNRMSSADKSVTAMPPLKNIEDHEVIYISDSEDVEQSEILSPAEIKVEPVDGEFDRIEQMHLRKAKENDLDRNGNNETDLKPLLAETDNNLTDTNKNSEDTQSVIVSELGLGDGNSSQQHNFQSSSGSSNSQGTNSTNTAGQSASVDLNSSNLPVSGGNIQIVGTQDLIPGQEYILVDPRLFTSVSSSFQALRPPALVQPQFRPQVTTAMSPQRPCLSAGSILSPRKTSPAKVIETKVVRMNSPRSSQTVVRPPPPRLTLFGCKGEPIESHLPKGPGVQPEIREKLSSLLQEKVSSSTVIVTSPIVEGGKKSKSPINIVHSTSLLSHKKYHTMVIDKTAMNVPQKNASNLPHNPVTQKDVSKFPQPNAPSLSQIHKDAPNLPPKTDANFLQNPESREPARNDFPTQTDPHHRNIPSETEFQKVSSNIETSVEVPHTATGSLNVKPLVSSTNSDKEKMVSFTLQGLGSISTKKLFVQGENETSGSIEVTDSADLEMFGEKYATREKQVVRKEPSVQKSGSYPAIEEKLKSKPESSTQNVQHSTEQEIETVNSEANLRKLLPNSETLEKERLLRMTLLNQTRRKPDSVPELPAIMMKKPIPHGQNSNRIGSLIQKMTNRFQNSTTDNIEVESKLLGLNTKMAKTPDKEISTKPASASEILFGDNTSQKKKNELSPIKGQYHNIQMLLKRPVGVNIEGDDPKVNRSPVKKDLRKSPIITKEIESTEDESSNSSTSSASTENSTSSESTVTGESETELKDGKVEQIDLSTKLQSLLSADIFNVIEPSDQKDDDDELFDILSQPSTSKTNLKPKVDDSRKEVVKRKSSFNSDGIVENAKVTPIEQTEQQTKLGKINYSLNLRRKLGKLATMFSLTSLNKKYGVSKGTLQRWKTIHQNDEIAGLELTEAEFDELNEINKIKKASHGVTEPEYDIYVDNPELDEEASFGIEPENEKMRENKTDNMSGRSDSQNRMIGPQLRKSMDGQISNSTVMRVQKFGNKEKAKSSTPFYINVWKDASDEDKRKLREKVKTQKTADEAFIKSNKAPLSSIFGQDDESMDKEISEIGERIDDTAEMGKNTGEVLSGVQNERREHTVKDDTNIMWEKTVYLCPDEGVFKYKYEMKKKEDSNADKSSRSSNQTQSVLDALFEAPSVVHKGSTARLPKPKNVPIPLSKDQLSPAEISNMLKEAPQQKIISNLEKGGQAARVKPVNKDKTFGSSLNQSYSNEFKWKVVKEARVSGFEKTAVMYRISMTDIMKWHDNFLNEKTHQDAVKKIQSSTVSRAPPSRSGSHVDLVKDVDLQPAENVLPAGKLNANLSFERIQVREGTIKRPKFASKLQADQSVSSYVPQPSSSKTQRTRMGPNSIKYATPKVDPEQLEKFHADVRGDLGIMPKIMKKAKSKQEGIEIASTWKQVQSVLNPNKNSEKKYSQDFKNRIIRECAEKGQKTVALEHSIPYNEISRWRLEAKKAGSTLPSPSSAAGIPKSQGGNKEGQPKTNPKKTSSTDLSKINETKALPKPAEQESLKIKIKLSSIGQSTSTSVDKSIDKGSKKGPSELLGEKNRTTPAVASMPKSKPAKSPAEIPKEHTDTSRSRNRLNIEAERLMDTVPAPGNIDEDIDLRQEVINFCLDQGVLKTQKKFNVTRQSIIDLMKEYDELNKYAVDNYNKVQGFKTRLVSREKTSVEVTSTATQPVIVKNLNDYIVTQEYMQTVVEYALKHGITAATRKYKRKTNTVRSWINQFQKEVKKKISDEQMAKEKELLASNMSVEEARQISNLEAKKKRQLLEAEFRRHIVEFAREFGITAASRRFKKKAATVKSWMGHCMKNERDIKRLQIEAEANKNQAPVQDTSKSPRASSPRVYVIPDVTDQKSPGSSRPRSPPQSPIWEQDFVIKPSTNSPLKLTFSPRRKSSPVIVIGSSAEDDSIEDETNDIETDDEENPGDYMEVAAWDINDSGDTAGNSWNSSKITDESGSKPETSLDKSIKTFVDLTGDTEESGKEEMSSHESECQNKVKEPKNSDTSKSLEASVPLVRLTDEQISPKSKVSAGKDDSLYSHTEGPTLEENEKINEHSGDRTSDVHNESFEGDPKDVSIEAGRMVVEEVVKIPYEDTLMFKILTDEVDNFIKSDAVLFEKVKSKPVKKVTPAVEQDGIADPNNTDGKLGPLKKFKKYADAEIIGNIEETCLFTGSRSTRHAANIIDLTDENDTDQVNDSKGGNNDLVEKQNENESIIEDKKGNGSVNLAVENVENPETKNDIKEIDIDNKQLSKAAYLDVPLNISGEKEKEVLGTSMEIETDKVKEANEAVIGTKVNKEATEKIMKEGYDLENKTEGEVSDVTAETKSWGVQKKVERSLFDMLTVDTNKPESDILTGESIKLEPAETVNKPVHIEVEKSKTVPDSFGLFGNILKQFKLPQISEVPKPTSMDIDSTSTKDAKENLVKDEKIVKADKEIEEKSELVKDKGERNLFDFIKLEPDSPTFPEKKEPVPVKTEPEPPRRQTRSATKSGTSPVKSSPTPSPVKLPLNKKPMFKFPKLASPFNFGKIAKLGLIKIKEDEKAKGVEKKDESMDVEAKEEGMKEETPREGTPMVDKRSERKFNAKEIEETKSGNVKNTKEKTVGTEYKRNETDKAVDDSTSNKEKAMEKGEVVMETFEQLRQRLAKERAAMKLEKEKAKAAAQAAAVNVNTPAMDEVDGLKDTESCEAIASTCDDHDDEMYKDFTPQKIVLILDISKKHGIEFASTSFGLPVSVIVNWIIEKDRKQRKAALSVSLYEKLKALKDIQDGLITKEEIRNMLNIDNFILDKWESEIGWLLKAKNVCDVLAKWTKTGTSHLEENTNATENTSSVADNECVEKQLDTSEIQAKLKPANESLNVTMTNYDDDVVITVVEKPLVENAPVPNEGNVEETVEIKNADNTSKLGDTKCDENKAGTEGTEKIEKGRKESMEIDTGLEVEKQLDIAKAEKDMAEAGREKLDITEPEKTSDIQVGTESIQTKVSQKEKTEIEGNLDVSVEKESMETEAGMEEEKQLDTTEEDENEVEKESACIETSPDDESAEPDAKDSGLPGILSFAKSTKARDFTIEQKAMLVILVQKYGSNLISKKFGINSGTLWNWQHGSRPVRQYLYKQTSSKVYKDTDAPNKGETTAVQPVTRSSTNSPGEKISDKGANKRTASDTSGSNIIADVRKSSGNENLESHLISHREGYRIISPTKLPPILRDLKKRPTKDYTFEQKVAIVKLVQLYGVRTIHKQFRIPAGSIWNWQNSKSIKEMLKDEESIETDKGAQKELNFDSLQDNDVDKESSDEPINFDTILDRVLVTSESVSHLHFKLEQKADTVCLINHFGMDYLCEKVPQIPRGTLWNWRHNRHITTVVDTLMEQINKYNAKLSEKKHRANVVGETVDKSDLTKKWVTDLDVLAGSIDDKGLYGVTESLAERVKRKRNLENENSAMLNKKPKLGPLSYKNAQSKKNRRSTSPSSVVSVISIHSNDFDEIMSDDETKTPSVVSRRSINSTQTIESSKTPSVKKSSKGSASGKADHSRKTDPSGKREASGKTDSKLSTKSTDLENEKAPEPPAPVYEVLRCETGAFDRMMVCYRVLDDKSVPSKSTETGTKRASSSEPATSQSVVKRKPPKESDVFDQSGNWVPLDEYYYGTNEGDPAYTEEKGEYRFKCWYCSKMLYNNVRAMQHIQGHIDASKQQNIDLSDLTQCKHCYKQFDTPFEMQTHVEKVHLSNKVLMCRICEKDFATPRDLMVHMKGNHHACEMPYVCHLCNFRSSMYSDVVDHFKKKHDSSHHLLCLYCLRTFAVKFGSHGWGTTQTYYGHLLKHQTKSQIKKCVVCRLTFFNANDVKVHRKYSHVSSIKSLTQGGKTEGGQKLKKGSTLKSLNAPSVSRIQDYGEIRFPSATSKSKCIECKMMMSSTDHYKKYVHCSMCRFATSCSIAYANHMMGFHSGQMSSLNLNIPWERPMKEPMYCSCGFSSKYGNKVADHLVSCAKWTCSTKKEFQSATTSPGKAGENKKEGSLLGMLGLVEKSTVATKIRSVDKPSSSSNTEKPDEKVDIKVADKIEKEVSAEPDVVDLDKEVENKPDASGDSGSSNEAIKLETEEKADKNIEKIGDTDKKTDKDSKIDTVEEKDNDEIDAEKSIDGQEGGEEMVGGDVEKEVESTEKEEESTAGTVDDDITASDEKEEGSMETGDVGEEAEETTSGIDEVTDETKAATDLPTEEAPSESENDKVAEEETKVDQDEEVMDTDKVIEPDTGVDDEQSNTQEEKEVEDTTEKPDDKAEPETDVNTDKSDEVAMETGESMAEEVAKVDEEKPEFQDVEEGKTEYVEPVEKEDKHITETSGADTDLSEKTMEFADDKKISGEVSATEDSQKTMESLENEPKNIDEAKAKEEEKEVPKSGTSKPQEDSGSSDVPKDSSVERDHERRDRRSQDRHHSGDGDRSRDRSHDSDRHHHDNRSHGSSRSDSYHGNRSSHDRDRSYERDRDRDRDYNRNRNYRDNRHDNRSGYGYQDNRGQGYGGGGGQGYRGSQGHGGYHGNRGGHHQDRNYNNRNHQNRGGYNQNYRGGYRGGYY